MNTHAAKTQENKSQTAANRFSEQRSGSETSFQFIDNRSEAAAQRKLQEMTNNSPQVKQLRAIQEMANNSRQAKQAAQLQAMVDNYASRLYRPIQKKENNTGLTDNLKSGIENLSGCSMDDAKVHYNPDKPAQLNAHASPQAAQRRPIHSSYHGDFDSDELTREEIIAIYKQLKRINGDKTAIEDLEDAMRNNEFIGAPIDVDSINEWDMGEGPEVGEIEVPRLVISADAAAQQIQSQLPGGATNYSIGVLSNGDLIISKVNGVTAATAAIANLVDFIRENQLEVGRNIYLAQKFNTSVGSNHAEMCLMAAAEHMEGNLQTIYCSGPHCAFCSAMMDTAGIALGNSAGSENQMGWTHPFVPLNYGQQLSSSMADQLAELKSLPKRPKKNQIQHGSWGLTEPDGRFTKMEFQ